MKKVRSEVAKEVAAKRPKAGAHGKGKKAKAKADRKQAKQDLKDND